MNISGIKINNGIKINTKIPSIGKVALPDIWEGGCFAPDGIFYGAHDGKLYKSTDFLKTRTQIDTCTKSGLSPVVHVTNTGAILWGYAPKIRRSANGVDFTDVLNVSGLTGWWPVIVRSPVTNAIIVTCYSGTASEDAYRSTNDGVTFTKILDLASPPLGITWSHLHMAEYTPGGVLLIHTGDNGTDRHTLKSTNDGDTWSEISSDVHPASMCSFVDDAGETVILCGSDYTDSAEIYRCRNFLAGTPEVITAYRDRDIGIGSVWVILNFGGGEFLAFTSNDSAVRQYPKWIASVDYGRTWNPVFCDSYSSAAYAGVTSSSYPSTFKRWALVNETQSNWNNKVRSFLVSLSGNILDIGR